jgi:hypothetical protein
MTPNGISRRQVAIGAVAAAAATVGGHALVFFLSRVPANKAPEMDAAAPGWSLRRIFGDAGDGPLPFIAPAIAPKFLPIRHTSP